MLRIVVAKPGLDGHDRGAKVVARALRDAGHEVIYTGLHQTPEQIVETAIQEDADAVGLSVLSGAHMTLFRKLIDLLAERDASDIVVFGGGIVPEEDVAPLEEIVELARRHDVRVMVDDAHGDGTLGPGGRGTIAEAGLDGEVDVIVGTLGKAFGSYGAYVAEVFRAGIESVHPSQRAAARSLGLTGWQSLRFVVLPQAVRRVLPPLLNDFVSLQKDSGLISILGVVDAIRAAQIASARTFNFTPYVVAALLFVLLAAPTGRIADALSARAARRQGLA